MTKEEKNFLIKFGLYLRRIREGKGWPLEYTEEKGFTAWQFLQRIETGKQNPSLLTLRKLAKTYNLSLSELFKDQK